MNLFFLFFLLLSSLIKYVRVEDSSIESKYIDLLPEEEKQEFIQKIARRILDEVKTDHKPKDEEIVLSDTELDAQTKYVQKILQEETSNLRRKNEKKDDQSSSPEIIESNKGKDFIDLTLRIKSAEAGELRRLQLQKIHDRLDSTNLRSRRKRMPDNSNINHEVSNATERKSDEKVTSLKQINNTSEDLNVTGKDKTVFINFSTGKIMNASRFPANNTSTYVVYDTLTDLNVSGGLTKQQTTQRSTINLTQYYTKSQTTDVTTSIPTIHYFEDPKVKKTSTTSAIKLTTEIIVNKKQDIIKSYLGKKSVTYDATNITTKTIFNESQEFLKPYLGSSENQHIDLTHNLITQRDKVKKYVEVTENSKSPISINSNSFIFHTNPLKKIMTNQTLTTTTNAQTYPTGASTTPAILPDDINKIKMARNISIQNITRDFQTNLLRTYTVFEVDPDEPPFTNYSINAEEQPYRVPIHNYAPSNAYFNAYNRLGPNDLNLEDNHRVSGVGESKTNLRISEENKYRYGIGNKNQKHRHVFRTYKNAPLLTIEIPSLMKKTKTMSDHDYFDLDYFFGRSRPDVRKNNVYLDTDDVLYSTEDIKFSEMPKVHVLHTPESIEDPYPKDISKLPEHIKGQITDIRNKIAKHYLTSNVPKIFENYFNHNGHKHLFRNKNKTVTKNRSNFKPPEKVYGIDLDKHFLRKGSLEELYIKSILRKKTQKPAEIFEDSFEGKADQTAQAKKWLYTMKKLGYSSGKIPSYNNIFGYKSSKEETTEHDKKYTTSSVDTNDDQNTTTMPNETPKPPQLEGENGNANETDEAVSKDTGDIEKPVDLNEVPDATRFIFRSSNRNEITEPDLFMNILEDMIQENDKGLQIYDWLGTTVDIEAALEKLINLSENEEISGTNHPSDAEILKYVKYLFSKSRDEVPQATLMKALKSHDVSAANNNVYESTTNALEMLRKLRLRRNKRKRHGEKIKNPLSLVQAIVKSLSRKEVKLKRMGTQNHVPMYRNVFYKRNLVQSPSRFHVISPSKDGINLNIFLRTLRNSLKEFHNAIKHISMVTNFKNQRWYGNIKELYLKQPTRKETLKVLIHIFTLRFLELIEQSAKDGLEQGYQRYVLEHSKEVRRTYEEIAFVIRLLCELQSIDD